MQSDRTLQEEVVWVFTPVFIISYFSGYLRQCDIISYSQDVDIGVFVKDFNYQIIADMHAHHLYLKHWFGELEDSLELSFVDQQSTLKLDIFFFYVEGDTYWNGGTQVKTGKKFK